MHVVFITFPHLLFALIATVMECFIFYLLTGVTWVSKVTNVTGKYMFLFVVGAMTGCIIIVPVGGLLFQLDPFSVVCFGVDLLPLFRLCG